MQVMDAFIRGLPKAELHMHLEGSISPELMLKLAQRNGMQLRWRTPDELRAAYEFSNLQSFLDLYYEGCKVLVTEQDFYDVTKAYLDRAHEDGVIRAEMFIGPQSFTDRGIAVATLLNGVFSAMDHAERAHGIRSGLLVSAQRHRTEAAALAMLQEIRPWSDKILGIGMGGAEVGNPPSRFARFFEACRDSGYRTTVHAGEEGPASYVREALDLKVQRIDHGNACLGDPDLVHELAERQIPLTVCPLSNLRLKVVPSMAEHPLRKLMDAGLHVTVNSDDPTYFGGYVSENLIACQEALNLSVDEIVGLARNSMTAAFASPDEQARMIDRLDAYVATPREPLPTLN